ncbi:MAG TPA: hypothetical protein HA349_01230 [Methanotrichaceae archaeon]|nr:hypothetical protein [Methanotrichaceae archaeon]
MCGWRAPTPLRHLLAGPHPHGPRHPDLEDSAVAGPSGPGGGGDRRQVRDEDIDRVVEVMRREIPSEKTI